MFLSHVKEIKSFLRIYKSILEILSWTSTLGANKKEENHFWARYAPSTSRQPFRKRRIDAREDVHCIVHWKIVIERIEKSSAEENRGTRAQPRRTRACARRNRKRSREQAKQSRCYFCAWKAGAPSGGKESRAEWGQRERERESLAALTREGEEYGRKVGSGRWWQCLSYLVWIAGWHRARQPRRSLIRGRQMMADRRRVMPARGSERERGKKEQSSFVLSTVCG